MVGEKWIFMSKVKKIYPSKRPIQKVLVTLPSDIVELIDNCARSIGMSRSAFLQVYFDGYNEQVVNFTEGWLKALLYYKKKEENAEKLEDIPAS